MAWRLTEEIIEISGPRDSMQETHYLKQHEPSPAYGPNNQSTACHEQEAMRVNKGLESLQR